MGVDCRVLVVAENASARFGGEAALPLHYYRELRARGSAAWLLVHARTRSELAEVFPGDPHIVYIEDSAWHRFLWRLGSRLPAQVRYLTTEFLSRISTQIAQRRIARQLIREHGIDVVHQPIPVSPREPSLLYGLGCPVVIGPMNGGMTYPPAFAAHEGRAERLLLRAGRASAAVLNFLMPGKRKAALLLVANERTRQALPAGTCQRVEELVENGVDLSLWTAPSRSSDANDDGTERCTTFVFMGRLIPLKCVDLLLRAFAAARQKAPMRLWILGDGPERDRLEQLAADLGLRSGGVNDVGVAHFAGWLPQATCLQWLVRADSLVLPSVRECGGAVVLEAMALAKPVIAAAWGGPLDYLDATCGVLVPVSSSDGLMQALEAAMIGLSASPDLRRRLGEAAAARVQAEFNWKTKVDRMVELYAQALQPRAANEGTGSGR
ncbi:MAG TPA: glycosyltransferase family 4 protein [Caldimonas sp.]|nr:glycosyltransferase family 4 protein [Caldimonas sp.]